MSAPFKVGDLVRLKNPWGPVMTVFSLADDGEVWTIWFDAHSRDYRGPFPAEVLELARNV